MRIVFLFVLLILVAHSFQACDSAGVVVAYSATVLANGLPEGAEDAIRANAESLIAPLLDARVDFTYKHVGDSLGEGGGRRLVGMDVNVEFEERELQVPQCPNCKKPQNWALCIELGCPCSCGGRRHGRVLETSDVLSSEEVAIVEANMTSLVEVYCGSAIDCVVEVVVTQLLG